MARALDPGAPDFLQDDTAIITAVPFTVCYWANDDIITSEDTFFWVGDKDATDEWFMLIFEGDRSGDPITVGAVAGGSLASGRTTTGFSAGVWHHAAGVFATSTDRSPFIDGGSKGNSTSDRTPSGLDRTTVGRRGDSSPSHQCDGTIAHVAVWNVDLTEQEIATLAAGFSPLRMRRDSLVGYWPINGQSPEYNVVGTGVNLTVNGTPPVAEEPPITQFIKAA